MILMSIDKFLVNRKDKERAWSFLAGVVVKLHDRPSFKFHQLFSKHIAKK